MAFEIRKASRKKAKLKLAMSGPSGSGKTYSALLIAYGLVGDWSKICVIDTENNSADLYANLGNFDVLPFAPPFSTDRYIQAIKEAEKGGYELVIIDSTSHEWQGEGGILESVDKVTAGANSKNSFSNGWKVMTPKHNEFMSAMLQSKCHVIATMRSKQDYQIVEENGKKEVKKIGLNPIQRDGVEFDFTLHFDMSNKLANTLKDRTQLFSNGVPFVPTVQTGKDLHAWCEAGEDADPMEYWKPKVEACETKQELVDLYNKYKTDVDINPLLQKLISDRRNVINNKPQPQTVN